MGDEDPPPRLDHPTAAAWREEVRARSKGLRFLRAWCAKELGEGWAAVDSSSIERHIEQALEIADGHEGGLARRAWNRVTGSAFERALANLDWAEVDLLRLAPRRFLCGAVPSIRAHVNRFLAKDDPRREAIKALESDDGLTDAEAENLIHALVAANTQRRRNLARVRSFRNMLRGGIAGAVALALAVAYVGWTSPASIPICFTPEANNEVTLVCPQAMLPLGDTEHAPRDLDAAIADTVRAGDILLIEFLGLLGAALTVAALLRNLRKGTSTPYNIPFSLAILKLPTGALTAVAGLVLMRADFVPGLSALDSSGQILGWALIFGIAQQLVTRIADNHADALLENVGGRGAAGDRPLKQA